MKLIVDIGLFTSAPELLATILSMRHTVHTALKDLLAKDEAQRRYWTFYEAISV